MINYVTGNIFDSNAAILVNPVNTKGVCGKGLALQFKERFPENYAFYRSMCNSNKYRGGDLLWWENLITDTKPDFICNFCTKEDWKDLSKKEYIEKGLITLANELDNISVYNINSKVAIPKLGCGCGGLDWQEVKQLIEEILCDVEQEVIVYE